MGTEAPRTLVVSDLHLGARGGRDILRQERFREPLLRELAGVERLVLLGDVLELRAGPLRDALAVAEPILREIAEAAGDRAEIVIVAGNHDHHLFEPWRERVRRASGPRPLGLESPVDWRAGEPLGEIAGWLGEERVRAAYPGVWLREDVLAMHGHYGDRHTTVPQIERLAAGLMARVLHTDGAAPRCSEDYEAVMTPVYAWIHQVVQGRPPAPGGDGMRETPTMTAWRALQNGRRGASLRGRALAGAFPAAVWGLKRAGLGELRADISAHGLRRAGLRAAGEVLASLGVGAEHFIFGHTHRAGPLPGDAPSEWIAPTRTRMWNTGCWVLEPSFVAQAGEQSPYWPGRAIELIGAEPPRPRSLLSGIELPGLAQPHPV